MNYTDKIEAYTTGKMSALDQLVFEQELAENGSLKEAFEAHQLTEALLGFTANNLSEAAILGTAVPQAETSGGVSKAIYYGASLLALCLIGLFTFIYTTSSETISTPTPTNVEATEAIAMPAVPTPSKQAAKETIIFQDPIQELKPIQKPAPVATPAKVKTKKINKPKPIAAAKKKAPVVTIPIKKEVPVLVANLSSKKQIQKGENVSFTAGQSITFEPGFVVEAGGSLHAQIGDKTLD